MGTTDSTHTELNFDTRILSNFIFQFSITLRLVASYPKNHPIITTSLQKVLDQLGLLLEFRDSITVGVARDTLMVEYALLDPKNPVYRSLAKVLFDHDIAAVTFNKNSTVEELLSFSEIMAGKRETLREMGGVQQAVSASGITNILLKEINYDLFSTTEEESISPVDSNAVKQEGSLLWENFVHGLIDGTLNPAGSQNTFADPFDPGTLADMMNELDNRSALKEESYATVIASFMGELHQGEPEGSRQNVPLEKLVSFVNRLNPELRRQFLSGAFTFPGAQRRVVEEMLAMFPDDLILEALADINSRTNYTPPVTINLLQRLSKKEATDQGRKTASTSVSPEYDEHLGEKLRIIFREDDRDEYVPSDYQRALRTITSMNSISMPELEEIEELRQTVLDHSVEKHVCKVILEIMGTPIEDYKAEALERNLLELLDYFLEVGDFSFLTELLGQLGDLGSEGKSHPVTPAIIQFFSSPPFLEMVLKSLNTWDRSKQADIRELIRSVGSPFVEPLLQCLAEEPNMSFRRSYLDCLFELGDKVRDAALAGLGDGRWYYVRNLIIILRQLDNPTILKSLRRFSDHPHPKVRLEFIRTLQHFDDPAADKLLLQDMDSTDKEYQLNAINLAEKSRSREVFLRLLAYLSGGKGTGSDIETKRAVVRTLGKIKNYEALPTLMECIETKYLLRQSAHNRLKAEIINSLCNYPAASVLLLEKISKSSQGEVAKLAREALKNIQGER